MPETTICRCLYCDRLTGRYRSSEPRYRHTVCGICALSPLRHESWEVRAGLPPWPRPLPLWTRCLGQTPLPDAEARFYRQQWEDRQIES